MVTIWYVEAQICIPVIYHSLEIIDRKYFIDNKVHDKIFSWILDFLKIFLPQHILLGIIHNCLCHRGEAINQGKNH